MLIRYTGFMPKDFNSSSRGKTKTIKKRLIYVYLPSLKIVNKWKKLAGEAGVSISKFVMEHVENSLHQEENEGEYTTRLELIHKNKQLVDENVDLRKRTRMLDTVVGRLEDELREYRVRPFVDEDFAGVRKYQSEIIDLFKEKGIIRKDDMLRFLGVNASEREVVKGVWKQVSGLESYGLVRDMGAKWKWMG